MKQNFFVAGCCSGSSHQFARAGIDVSGGTSGRFAFPAL